MQVANLRIALRTFGVDSNLGLWLGLGLGLGVELELVIGLTLHSL